MADINVNIVRQTGGVTRAGFGTALILSNTAHPFTIYSDVSELSEDFASDTVVYGMASALYAQPIQPKQVAVAGIDYEVGVDAVTDLSAFLDTLVQDGKDFYALLQEQDDEASQVEVSSWSVTNNKLHFIRTDVLASAYTGTLNNNTAVYYTTQAEEYPECAAAGYGLPLDPGSLTWANIELSGITPESLTGEDKSDLLAGRFNVVINSYGRIVTNNGFLQGNLYIDQQRSQDFVKARMEENFAQLLINNNKIPYDDTGIAQVVSVATKTLNLAFGNGIIASSENGSPLFTVTSVPRADIPQQDIDERVLRTVSFSYIEAGAIEGAEITGNIVVEL